MNFTLNDLTKLSDSDIEEWFDEIPTSEKREWMQEYIEFAEDARKLQILRAGFKWQVEALETLQEMLNSQNDENPWLGITAALALKLTELDRVTTERDKAISALDCSLNPTTSSDMVLADSFLASFKKDHPEWR